MSYDRWFFGKLPTVNADPRKSRVWWLIELLSACGISGRAVVREHGVGLWLSLIVACAFAVDCVRRRGVWERRPLRADVE